MLTKREFLGEPVYLAWLADCEDMRALRNKVSASKPSEEERAQLKVNKPWERFYASVLFDKKAAA